MKKIPTLEEILTQPAARESYDRLIKSGLGKQQLADHISLLLHVPPKMPDLVPRRSDRRTKRLADRIKNMADEIQQVNEKSGLLYEIVLEASAVKPRKQGNTTEVHFTRSARQEVAAFRSLPALLRTYAEYLRSAFKMHKKGWSELHDLAICRFQREIKDATGIYHDRHVASLLSAAFRAAGHDQAADRFNSNQLKALRHNNKKLFSTPKYNA